jgi:hypothetical protein
MLIVLKFWVALIIMANEVNSAQFKPAHTYGLFCYYNTLVKWWPH